MSTAEMEQALIQVLTEKGIGSLPEDIRFFQTLRTQLEDTPLTDPYTQQAWVFAAINAIAGNISAVPFVVETRPKTKDDEAVVQNPTDSGTGGDLARLFSMVNPTLSRSQLWQGSLIHTEKDGEAFWILGMPMDKQTDGQVPETIWIANPKQMEPKFSKDMHVGWELDRGGKRKKLLLTVDQVIQFKYFNPNNQWRGLSPLEAIQIGLATDHKMQLWNTGFFDNSADPGGIIMSEKPMGQEKRDQIQSSWEQRHKGALKRSLVSLLEGGMTYQQIEVNHRDMEFLEGRKWTREEILAVFKVPKSEVSLFEDVNFATALSQDRGFWNKTLIPKMQLLLDVLDHRLFMKIEGGKYRGRFDLSGVEALRENLDTKSETAKRFWDMGVPFNQINRRLALGFEAVAGGDIGYIPSSVLPVGTAPPVEDAARKQIAAPHISRNLNLIRIARWQTKAAQILDPNERRVRAAIKKYFRDLRKAQLQRLKEEFPKRSTKKGNITRVSSSDADVLLFIQKEWNDRLVETMSPIYESILKAAVDDLALDLGTVIDLPGDGLDVLSFLEDKAIKVKNINQTIRNNLREQLKEGLSENETVEELSDRIRESFNDIQSEGRIRRIAMTETAQTVNGARNLGMKAGGVEFHEWLTSADSRVRDTHAAIDMQVRRLGERFSNGLLYPADVTSGKPGEVINCRCLAEPAEEPKS